MSCTPWIWWISLAILLSTVVPATDSCSSHFGSRKARRTIETAETPESKFETFPPTTLDDTTTDQTPTDMKPRLDNHHHHHRELCDAEKSDLCLNGGTCYEIVIRKEPEPFCECATHFEGYRCQYKSLEGSYGGGIRLPRSNPRKNRRLVSRMLFLCYVLFCLTLAWADRKHLSRRGHHAHQRKHRSTPSIGTTPQSEEVQAESKVD